MKTKFKVRFLDVDYRDIRSLVTLTFGRFELLLFPWTRPGVDWGRYGYDCIWRTWGVYPLFELEAIDPQVLEPVQVDAQDPESVNDKEDVK